MEKKKVPLAVRVVKRIMLWLVVFVLGLSYFVFSFSGESSRKFYSEIYKSKLLINYEYTRRVISDVYVNVINNIYYLEHTLDKPDGHKATLERIVGSGTRVRSCGIGFVEDYYPSKGHLFYPYAWRNVTNLHEINSENIAGDNLNYINSDWFRNAIAADSATWSDPFSDSFNDKVELVAYVTPIHDETGRPVGVLSADISLDWFAVKLAEMDSVINKSSLFLASKFGLSSCSYLVNHDGAFITHPDEERIMRDNFYNHIESCNGSDAEALIANMTNGKMSENKSLEKFVVDDQECYVFYVPVKYTNWVMVTVVPCHAIDIVGYINGCVLILVLLIVMLAIVLVCYFYVRSGMEPMKNLTMTVDDIAKGNYDTPLPELKHNDEFDGLSDSIEKMQFEISKIVDAAKSKG